MDIKLVVGAFYDAIRAGDMEALENMLDDNFELVVPASGGVLAGRYVGKEKFLNLVLPGVFSCVDPHHIAFCEKTEIICAEGNRVVAIAQNNGLAATGLPYNQTYAHIFTVEGEKLTKLIEFFDTDLANRALWGNSAPLDSDEAFAMSQVS